MVYCKHVPYDIHCSHKTLLYLALMHDNKISPNFTQFCHHSLCLRKKNRTSERENSDIMCNFFHKRLIKKIRLPMISISNSFYPLNFTTHVTKSQDLVILTQQGVFICPRSISTPPERGHQTHKHTNVHTHTHTQLDITSQSSGFGLDLIRNYNHQSRRGPICLHTLSLEGETN